LSQLPPAAAPAASTGSARRELLALTGLRAWAALWVVAHHHSLFVTDVFSPTWLGILDRGYLGVDVFFTLSGFVLAYNYGGRIRSAVDHVRFVALRIARLYPLHLATLAIVVLVARTAGLTGLEVRSPGDYALDRNLFLHLLMLHGWGLGEGLRFNRPSWSISAEFFAYLLFPLAWALAIRFRKPLAAAAAALAASLATVACLRALGHASLHVPTGHVLVRVSGEFLAGCLAFRCLSLLGGATLAAGPTTLLVLGVLVLAASPLAEPWMAPASAVLVALLAAGRGPALRLFVARPVVFLGRISYSIYLTHMLVMSALQRVLPSRRLAELDAPAAAGVLALHAVAIVAFAALTYYAIERPARDALRARIRRWLPERADAGRG
jgi:peptidoglycan/LPS O-acetylase OafA/YrhL